MNNLHIAFQDGFASDTVIVTVNGAEKYNKHNVSTNLVISRADTVDVEIEDRTAHVTVSVPSRATRSTLTVDVIDTPYLGVSINNHGELTIIPSKESFRYF